MNIKSIVYKAGFAVLLAGLLLSTVAFAENGNKHSQEAKNVGSGLEVQIGESGRVLVRGAKVTQVSGDKITATTAWGSANLTWTVNVSSSTEFAHKKGGKSSIREVAVGNIISFNGVINPNAGAFTVDAKVIKNWSIEKVRMTIQGKVKTAPASTTPTTFILASGNKDYTVKVPSGISILNVFWQTIPVGSIKVNDNVRVYGAVGSDLNVDATVVRDISVR